MHPVLEVLMPRLLIACLVSLTFFAGRASAHFVFVVPDPAGATARVVMSEDLKPDGDVDVAIIAGVKLAIRDSAAKTNAPLATEKSKDALAVAIPAGDGVRVIHGLA